MKLSKVMKLVLIIALIACLVSMIGTSLMQANWGATRVTQKTVTLNELATMIDQNNKANNKNVEITFQKTDSIISFAVYEPVSADGKKVPGIVCTHGGFNQKEMQMPFYIELARRGFVVIAFDWAGHGRTDNSVDKDTGSSQGMTAMAEYMMSLKQVNEKQVGVTGHSWSNFGCATAIKIENTTTKNNRIAAYVNQALSMTAFTVNGDMVSKGFFFAVNIAKYDEFDTAMGNTDFMNNKSCKAAIAAYYPGINFEQPVQEGMIYTASGPKGVIEDNGKRAVSDTDVAIAVYNPSTTHPGFHFSHEGTLNVVKQFYAAFGTPDGAQFIPSSNQVWPIVVCFEVLGLLGFFALLFPIASLLLKTKFFAVLRKKENEEMTLYSLRSWKDGLPFAVTVVALLLFTFFTYVPTFTAGDSHLNSVFYTQQACNGFGLWSMVCGLFLVGMLLVQYGLRKLTHRKDGADLGNPFASATVDTFKKIFRSVLFAFSVVALMLIPVYMAYYIFGADFRICLFVVTADELKDLPNILLRYLPLWAIFYVPNAIFNANTRFKEIPDWASTVICGLVNSLGLIVFIAIDYAFLFSKGVLWNHVIPIPILAGIDSWIMPPILFFAAFSSRFILKRTNNAWAAGLTNAVLVTLIACAANGSVMPDFIF